LRTVTNTSNFDLGGLDEPALRHWQSAARFARSSDVKLVLLIFDASLQRLADFVGEQPGSAKKSPRQGLSDIRQKRLSNGRFLHPGACATN
jgi:hypothetical protein